MASRLRMGTMGRGKTVIALSNGGHPPTVECFLRVEVLLHGAQLAMVTLPPAKRKAMAGGNVALLFKRLHEGPLCF